MAGALGAAIVLWSGVAHSRAHESKSIATQQKKKIRDATGTTVEVPLRANRIITLAPSLAEWVMDLGDQSASRIIGVSDRSVSSPALAQKKSVGPFHRVDIERVISLKPDLVLATKDGNSQSQINRLRQLGLTVVVVSTQSWSEVLESVRLIGAAIAAEDQAEAAIRKLQDAYAAAQKRSAPRETPRVMIQLSDQPLVVAGPGSFIGDLLAAVGAKNCFMGKKSSYPKPTTEEVIRLNCERIIILSMDPSGTDPNAVARWNRFTQLAAVQVGGVRAMPGDSLMRPTLGLIEGISRLEKIIHGDR